MTYAYPGDLASQARKIAENVTTSLDDPFYRLGPNVGQVGSLATAIEVLAKAVEQLAREQR